jgi:hypothetical protein
MKRKYTDYEKYFTAGLQARVLIRLTEDKFLDRNAEIISLDHDLVRLEILGDVTVNELSNKAGARVTVSVSSGWGLCRCNASLEQVFNGKEICIRLTGEVSEQQRREYFRLDIDVPLIYKVPDDQHQVSVTAKWNENRKKYQYAEPVMFAYGDGYKVAKWLGGDDLLPQNVNLSGGGVRFKPLEYIEPLTMVLVDIFLPLSPSLVISTVAEVVRCNEVQLTWEKGTKYNTAMKFVKIDEKDRETIISFIFGEQRNQLQAMREKKR